MTMSPARKFSVLITAFILFAWLFNPAFAATLPLKLTNIGVLSVPEAQQEDPGPWYYTGHRPQFKGTTQAGVNVCITIESDTIEGCTTANGDGVWAWTPPSDIPDGDHSVSIVASYDDDQGSLSFTLGINTGPAQTGDPLYQAVMLIALSSLTLFIAVRAFRKKWELTL